MSRLSLILFVAAACGRSPKPPPATPLPNDKPAAAPPATQAQAAKPGEPDDGDEKAKAEPPTPAGPVEVKIPAAQTTVKIVSDGTGKKQPLRYTAQPGSKQDL